MMIVDPLRNHYRLGGRRLHRNLRKRWRRVLRRLVRMHARPRFARRLLHACLGGRLALGWVAIAGRRR